MTAVNVRTAQFRVVPAHLGHALHLASLPLLHRDPFDRMLVAQAQLEGLTIVTADRKLSVYDVAAPAADQ